MSSNDNHSPGSPADSKSLICTKKEPDDLNAASLPNLKVNAGNIKYSAKTGLHDADNANTTTSSNPNVNAGDIKYSMKTEPHDDNNANTTTSSKSNAYVGDIKYSVKAEPHDYKNNTNAATASNKKKRKRKADNISKINWKTSTKKNKESPYLNACIEGHTCDNIIITKMPSSVKIIPPLPDIQVELMTQFVETIDKYVKSELPSGDLRSGREKDQISCSEEKWERLLSDEFVTAAGTLNDNMLRSVDAIILTKSQIEYIMNKVIGDLNEAFDNEKSANRWNLFGPYLEGLVEKNSEVNIHLECTPVDKTPEDLFHKFWVSLSLSENFCNLREDEKATNVLSIYHKSTETNINVWFATSTAMKVRCSRLKKLFLDMNPNLRYLAVYVRMIFRKYDLEGCSSSGGFSLDTVFWLVVFFMQKKNLLPAVIDVRKAAEILHYVSGWDCSLPEDFSYSTQPTSLYSLFLGFFDFYKNFEFLKYVICPYLGRAVLVSDFQRLLIPAKEFSVYLRQLRNPEQSTIGRNVINVQDPTDLGFFHGHGNYYCLNKFIAHCHHFSSNLQNKFSECKTISRKCLCQRLPSWIYLDNYHPYDLMLNLLLNFRLLDLKKKDIIGKINQCYILEAIRKLMEFVFKFEKKSIVIAQNVTQVGRDSAASKRTFPVMYFEYYSSENTWKCNYMKEIIPRREKHVKPVQAYLRCEVCLEQRQVWVFIESNASFVDFLRVYFLKLFEYTLTQIIPC